MQQNQSVFVSSWQVLRLTMRWWWWKGSKSSFSSSCPTSKSSMIMICKKTRKCSYLGDLSPKWKNNSALFPSTFKVEENKVPLFFHLRQNDRDMAIWLFLHYTGPVVYFCSSRTCLPHFCSSRTCYHPLPHFYGHTPGALTQNASLFSSTPKVEGNKVLLYFHLWLKCSRYCYCQAQPNWLIKAANLAGWFYYHNLHYPTGRQAGRQARKVLSGQDRARSSNTKLFPSMSKHRKCF